jgi:hypothetical protein
MQKTNYYYIDESGHINNDTNVFIHGCIKTDSPNALQNALNKLKLELKEDLYFNEFISRIDEEGFHAVENHPDIRSQFYKLLPLIDYRAYFVVIDKKSDFFINLKKRKNDFEIFEMSLKKLLTDRLLKGKKDKNIFYFENLLLEGKSLQKIVENIFIEFENQIHIEYHIVGKEEINLSVVDYFNYVIFKLLNTNKPEERMKYNFNILADKIGVVYIMNKCVYLSRKKGTKLKVKLDNLFEQFGG